MKNREYIRYLNTLHNVNANNSNAYTETNTTNPFFQKTMVERDVGKYLLRALAEKPSHILILTGHAGDGKTGLLYQTLKNWHTSGNQSAEESMVIKSVDSVTMPNGIKCLYVKDFSELDALKRHSLLEICREEPQKGHYVFLVANTGSLLVTFREIFSDEAQIRLVGAIDENTGEIMNYDGTPIAAVNVATLDNSAFIEPFLRNIISDALWMGCAECGKRDCCPILHNRQFIAQFFIQTTDFITKHYIWQQEYGRKLTIRQMVANLSYSITGGLECADVKRIPEAKFRYLFSNLFFGYQGVHPDRKATVVKAIGDIFSAGYDQKRLRADERLFIQDDLSDFPDEVRSMLNVEREKTYGSELWQRAVRRAYLLFHLDIDGPDRQAMMEDVFSHWFPRYLQLRSGEIKPNSYDNELLQDALQMIFTGTMDDHEKQIPVTMNRDGGMTQNVQLIYDTLPGRKVKLYQKIIPDFSQETRYGLYPDIAGNRLSARVTLPLLNYFKDIRRGVIATDIDPQLSQGVDSLRAQIINCCDSERSEMELLTMRRRGWKFISAELENGKWILTQ